jgi:cellulose synthase/poly-beta-1,6-N-acetylglucosamine synthase-like glycosyltransferase
MHNFWDIHGFWFIFFMFFFPRLTLLFSSVVTGGIFWWLGFIFAPRLLVAILATLSYIQTNPVLVIFAWIWALYGEKVEKKNIVFNVYNSRTKKNEDRENLEKKYKDVIDV